MGSHSLLWVGPCLRIGVIVGCHYQGGWLWSQCFKAEEKEEKPSSTVARAQLSRERPQLWTVHCPMSRTEVTIYSYPVAQHVAPVGWEGTSPNMSFPSACLSPQLPLPVALSDGGLHVSSHRTFPRVVPSLGHFFLKLLPAGTLQGLCYAFGEGTIPPAPPCRIPPALRVVTS